MTAALHGAPRTLLVSLLTRHLASSRPDPVISDPAASALIRQLGLALARRDWSFQAAQAAPRQDESRYRWGVRRLSELTTWHPRLELVESWHLMDYRPAAWHAPLRIMRRLTSVRAQAKVGHFRVAPAAPAQRP